MNTSFIQDLWIQCTPFFELDTDMSDETPLQTVLNHYTEKFEQRVVVVNKNGIDELDEDDQPLFLPLSSKMSARDMQESDPSRLTYLAIQWHEGLLKDRLNVLALEKETCHASVLETRKKKQTGITLKDCFENVRVCLYDSLMPTLDLLKMFVLCVVYESRIIRSRQSLVLFKM